MSALPDNAKATALRYAAKWVPVVNDYCIGCGKCVERCPHSCLTMVWDAAKLAHPERCVSGGDCVEACGDNAIHMQWAPMRGNRVVGQWRDGEDPPEANGSGEGTGVSGLFKRWFGRAA